MTHQTPDPIWAFLLAARVRRTGRLAEQAPFGIRLRGQAEPERTRPGDGQAALVWDGDSVAIGPGLPEQARDLVELYLPVLSAGPHRPLAIGHLGQSLDAQIATRTGDSCYVTGRENMTHLHRMRALCDAVIVGAGTVAADDPRLTTRLVSGPNPVRVVIDPERRLSANHRLFRDGEAPSLLVCAADRVTGRDPEDGVIGVPRHGAGLALPEVRSALARRGLHALFIEGGGVTVTHWMTAGLLDRLQLATAPVLIGDGRPGLRLPAVETMSACRRPVYRLFQMGEDILWDLDLRRPERKDAEAAQDPPSLTRRLR